MNLHNLLECFEPPERSGCTVSATPMECSTDQQSITAPPVEMDFKVQESGRGRAREAEMEAKAMAWHLPLGCVGLRRRHFDNTLEACEVKDKALSAGEESSITLKNMFVKNSDMGVVAKDQSKVRLENLVVERTKVPIALFIKKPEFGPPSLIISQSTPDSVLAESLISNDSLLKVGNQTIRGLYSSKDVLGKLYGNEFGVKTVR